jgi:membrane associated rhomboid family serine protease
MSTIWQDLKKGYAYGNTTIKLLYINVILYFSIQLFIVPLFLMGIKIDYFQQFLSQYFYVPSSFSSFIFKPWTIFSYMFLHANGWHLLFNMLVLYGFGRITNDLIQDKKILPLYLFSGISGALLFILFYQIFPAFQGSGIVPLVGASASVMGILVAAATLSPKYQISVILIGPVSLQYIVFFFILLDIISVPFSNPGGHIAHLGGALWGWSYIRMLRNGINVSAPFEKIWESIHSGKKKTKKIYPSQMQVYHQSTANTTSSQTNQTDKKTNTNRLDLILDKINRSGMSSLTEEERNFLEKKSKDVQ